MEKNSFLLEWSTFDCGDKKKNVSINYLIWHEKWQLETSAEEQSSGLFRDKSEVVIHLILHIKKENKNMFYRYSRKNIVSFLFSSFFVLIRTASFRHF